MSVEDLNVIDFASIDAEGRAVLTISDHLEWDEGNEHLLALQNKINLYLGAIEGGELYEKYPQARDKRLLIRVVAKHVPSDDGWIFLERVKETLEGAGYGFEFSRKALEEPE